MKLKMIFNFISGAPRPSRWAASRGPMHSYPALLVRVLALSLTCLLACSAAAQSRPIQDNSFLVEEAYNQETGVVQHINSFVRLANGSWNYSFTQEWPVPHYSRNQISYTVGATTAADYGTSGWSDTLLNYRYQLVGNGDSRIAVAPRVSIIFPTGDARQARGFGGTGVQVSLPVSIVLKPDRFVAHTNIGATLVPNATNSAGEQAAVHGYNFGQSLIWLAHPRFNVMFETTYVGNDSVVAPRKTAGSNDWLLNPGVRWAYNLPHGLQIVPGISVPIGVGPSAGQKGILLYLSFEHPMWHEK